MSAELLSSVDAFIMELASFEPRLCNPEKCVVVVEQLARLEKVSAAARARTAARAAECGAHRRKGFVKPSDWLARATGSSTSEAERELDTAKRLDDLPETREAVSKGELSLGQAHEVAATEAACPGSERAMVEKAKTDSLKRLKDEGPKRRLAAVDPDELARRQRDVRFHRHWRDEHGTWKPIASGGGRTGPARPSRTSATRPMRSPKSCQEVARVTR